MNTSQISTPLTPTVPVHILKYKSRLNRQQDSVRKSQDLTPITLSKPVQPDLPHTFEIYKLPDVEKRDDILHDYLDDVIEMSKHWGINSGDFHELIVSSEIEYQFLQTLRSLINRQQKDVLSTYVKKVESALKKGSK